MNTRFYNARLLSFAKEAPEAIQDELWVCGDRITLAGTPDTAAPQWDREIDCKGGVLLPGFKNAHAHSPMVFLRSLADDVPLSEWFNNAVLPMEGKLTPDDAYWMTTLAIMEYVSGGITAAFDMYFHLDAIAQSAIDSGFRTVFCSSGNNYGGTGADLIAEYKKYNSLHPLISCVAGFHAEYTTSLPLMREYAEANRELRSPFFAHNSETLGETQGCIERYGKTPTALMESLGMFDFGGGGFHMVHASEEDLEIFKRRGLYAVINSGSNAKLASGTAPAQRMYELNIPVALGTDGAASNNCLDMFREMYLTSGLQKLRYGAVAGNANEILRSACVVGAEAMGLKSCTGLEVGMQADVALIDVNAPNIQPENNIVKNLVYSGGKQNVALTMIAGQIVYDRGEFPTIGDSERIYDKCNGIVRRMKEAL